MASELSRDRRATRRRLLEGALCLVDKADLTHFLRFVTISALCDETGLSNGAVYSAFGDGPRAVALTATLETLAALPDVEDQLEKLFEETVDRISGGDDSALDDLANGASTYTRAWTSGTNGRFFTLNLVAAAAAATDEAAASVLRTVYVGTTQRYMQRYERLLAASRREPVAGLDAAAIAVVLTALTDGMAMRLRFDDGIDDRLVATAFKAVWAGTTRHAGLTDDDLELRIALRGAGGTSRLTDGTRRAIAVAVSRMYRQTGWSSIAVPAVADAAGVSANTVRSHYGDRHGLAAVIWAGFVDEMHAQLAGEPRVHVVTRLRHLLRSVAQHQSDHPEVTDSLLIAVQAYTIKRRRSGGRPDPNDAADPRNSVPLPGLLADVMKASPRAFKPGYVDDHDQVMDFATFVMNSLLLRGMTRSDEDVDDRVAFVMRTCVEGALRRRPPVPSGARGRSGS